MKGIEYGKKNLKKYWTLYLAIIGILILFLIGYLMNGNFINFEGWKWQK